jgi:putative endonuclease
MWHVYIVECYDKKLYTGVTNNIDRRVEEHNSGKGAKFTRARTPVKLVYFEKMPTRSDALKRESFIKKLSRDKKLDLIES